MSPEQEFIVRSILQTLFPTVAVQRFTWNKVNHFARGKPLNYAAEYFLAIGFNETSISSFFVAKCCCVKTIALKREWWWDERLGALYVQIIATAMLIQGIK